MSQLHAATSDLVTVRPEETIADEFWEIVCAEDDWLRAEFDAIVASEDPDRRRGDPRPATMPGRQGPPSRGALLPRHAGRPRTLDAPVRRPPRQRSPPPRGTA